MNDFHTTSTHIARKQHRCECSLAAIMPGEKYVRFTGVGDGEFYSVAVREDIAEIYRRRNREAWRAGDDGLAFSELGEDVFESLNRRSANEQALADAKALLAANPEGFQKPWDRYCAQQVARVIMETMN